jgi:hypothetical protein
VRIGDGPFQPIAADDVSAILAQIAPSIRSGAWVR